MKVRLPLLVEKGKESFVFGVLQSKVTQLLPGSLRLCDGLVVVGSTVERTESVLHSSSGTTLQENGEPRKLARDTPVVEYRKCLRVASFWRKMVISVYLEGRGI